MRDPLTLAGGPIKATIACVLLWLALLFPSVTQASRLPLKAYTTANGLAHNEVNKIVRDSRGFLWFCTGEGLSRFDGYTFRTYGRDEGLTNPYVNDFLETRAGEFWVATNGGLMRFNPKGVPSNGVVDPNNTSGPMFTLVNFDDDKPRSKAVTVLIEGRDGTIWCGTYKGLFRISKKAARNELTSVSIGLPTEYPEQANIYTMIEDRFGTLWIGGASGLYRRWPNGTINRYGKSEGFQFAKIFALLEDRSGHLWVGTDSSGLFRLTNDATTSSPRTDTYNMKNGLATNWIFVIYESGDGKLWVGTNRGLYEFSDTNGKTIGPSHFYTEREGLSFYEVVALGEDRDRNLWLGTNTTGAMKFTRHGFTTFDGRDGVKTVTSIFQSDTGELYAQGDVLGDTKRSLFEGARLDFLNPGSRDYWRRLGRLDNQRLTWLIPDVLRGKYLGWSDKPTALRARSGHWWIGTGEGLYVFPPVKNFADLKSAQPLAVYQLNDTPITMIYRLYEDVRGDIWFSVAMATGHGLARWDHQTRTLHDMAQTKGLPSVTENLPTAFREDSRGDLWVGFNRGEVARYRSGQFTLLSLGDGVVTGRINDLYLDKHGHLWIGTFQGGVFRSDNPTDEHPVFINYTTRQGLSSNYGSALVEDLYGRIYVGTAQGLDRLDPTTGQIKHFTTADGLASGLILTSFRARDGQLWFGASQGLSYFLPDPPQSSFDPPPILLTGVRVDGVAQQVAANGDSEFFLPALSPGGNHLQIDFVGLSFASGESLLYQYRLDGADKDWSTATAQRTVNYANLGPGNYRFLVRALTSDGSLSTTPAVLTFGVKPHIWQRWWFLVLVTLTLTLIVYAFYRYRVQRLLQIVNIRSRIAMDLHDDIGSNLTRISLLSEVAKQNAGIANGSEDSPLMSISRIARESVGSMSDIVWAIDPKADTLLDLTRKMRQHADEVFTLRDIELEFNAPGAKEGLRLGVDVRRDLLLIFKEAVNNAARHSRCTRVGIDLRLQTSRLLLEIEDNGIGFDDAVETQGHGLRSMKQRVRALAGTLEIVVQPGIGTIIRVNIPVTRKVRIF